MQLLLLLFFSVFGVSLCSAQNVNFFIVPGSRPAQLNSGNKTSDYPVYKQHASTQFSWNTNWTKVSLVLYQNENSSAIRLFENRENGSKKYSFDMNPDVNLTWNDVFFLTLWNENQQTEGGPRYFSSSYFRINASDSSPGGGNNNNNNNNNSKNSNSGLSPAAKIGIGVGVGVGVPLLVLAGAAVFYLRRRRSKGSAAKAQQKGAEDSAGAGAGGYSSQLPPISEASGDAAYKAELPDESTTPCRAELPDGTTSPLKQTEPSEVDAANVGVGVQSRFIELPGN